MIVKAVEKLFEFCASLKLAIILILSLAFFLASATIYEAKYGTQAVQHVVYGNQAFVLLMALLAINVMAAVLVRYPWKKKQTGFIITHIGIEVLLAGCLISMRSSIDGQVSLQQGATADTIDQNYEQLSVIIPDALGHDHTHIFPRLNLWSQAGYPSLAEFVASPIKPLPDEPRWPEGPKVVHALGSNAQIEILDWLPAAKPKTELKPVANGFPAVVLHLGGTMPNGMPMNQDFWLCADGTESSVKQMFGGTLEATLWKARDQAEIDDFLHPPPADQLPAMGRLSIHIDGKPYAMDVSNETLHKPERLGESGYTATIDQYLAQAKIGPDGLVDAPDQPVNPMIKVTIKGPSGSRQYAASAMHPQFTIPLDDDANHAHAGGGAADPVIIFTNPATYKTAGGTGQRGRLQLLQAPDGKLYARRFGINGLEETYMVEVGQEHRAWMSFTITVTQDEPKAMIVESMAPAHVAPKDLDSAQRAMRVALIVDGQRSEAWLQRAQPVTVETPRGPAQISYEFEPYKLPYTVTLDHAEQDNDPGTNNPAAYKSDLTVADISSGAATKHHLLMNEPMTVGGLTFYQSSFNVFNDGGPPMVTYSVRGDPGWPVKYAGCILISLGIFTMFYMKAYFQKAVPAAVSAAKPATTQAGGKKNAGKRKVAAVEAA